MKKTVLPIFFFIRLATAGWTIPVEVVSAPTIEIGNFSNYLQMAIVAENSVEQVYNGIQQIQQMQRQIEQHIENLKHLERPDSIGEAIRIFDGEVSFIRNLESQVNSATITIGNSDIPITEVYKLDQVYDIFTEDMRTILDTDYTDQQKAYIYSHFGMTPSNYLYLVEKRKRVEKMAAETRMLHDKVIGEDYVARTEAIRDLDERAALADSQMEIDEIIALQNSLMNQQMSNVQVLLAMLAETMSQMNSEIHAERHPNRLQKPVSDGFIEDVVWGSEGNPDF